MQWLNGIDLIRWSRVFYGLLSLLSISLEQHFRLMYCIIAFINVINSLKLITFEN